MGKASVFFSIPGAAMAMFALLAAAGHASHAAEPQFPVSSPGNNVAAAGPFLSAIKDEQTSIVQAEPKCGYGTILTGALVMETPKRVGFPFNATTFASPQGTFTTITTTENAPEAVVDAVANSLNARANNYIKRLLRNCSL